MVYFCKRPYTPRTSDETVQWGRVLDFQHDLPKQQLWWTYTRLQQFNDLLREHLTRYVLTHKTSLPIPNHLLARPARLDGFAAGPTKRYAINTDSSAGFRSPRPVVSSTSSGVLELVDALLLVVTRMDVVAEERYGTTMDAIRDRGLPEERPWRQAKTSTRLLRCPSHSRWTSTLSFGPSLRWVTLP